MKRQHHKCHERLVTALERSGAYSQRAIIALRTARALTSWAVVITILGVGGWSDTSAVIPFLLLAAIIIPARLKIGTALDNLIWARDQARDLPDPDLYEPGEILTIRNHPSPLTGFEEPVLAEILSDDGEESGTARIVADPFTSPAHSHRGGLHLSKGDAVKYRRAEGSYTAIISKA
jgi:hypothetical protein